MKRTLSIFLMTAVIFCANIFAQEMSNDVKKLYNAAIKAQKSGDFAGAVAKIDEALKLEKHPELFFRKGVALRKNNKPELAIQSFQEAIKLKPEYDAAHFYIGSSLFSGKKYEDAIAAFEKTMEVTKNKKYKRAAEKNIKKCKEKIAYPFVVEGNTLTGASKWDAAISKFKKANEVFPRADAFAGLANAYYEKGDYASSIKSASESLKLNKKKNAAAHFFLAMSYKAQNNAAKAKEHFLKCKKDKNFRQRAEYELKEMK
ncbi:MAG: tetratricopeptide repeat protein [Rhodothermaceae bacterium]